MTSGRRDTCIPSVMCLYLRLSIQTISLEGRAKGGAQAEHLPPLRPFQGEKRSRRGHAGQQAQNVRGDNKQSPVSGDRRGRKHSNELLKASSGTQGLSPQQHPEAEYN